MRLDQVLKVVEKYEAELKDDNRQPERFTGGFPLKGAFPGREQALRHLLWMCGEIKSTIADVKVLKTSLVESMGTVGPIQMELQDEVVGKIEKAMRWLGFMQGTLWLAGAKSIETMREDNRGPGD